MALADYKLCDKCNSKAFYDSELHYDEETNMPGYVGDWAVLCTECAKRFEVKIVERSEPKP